MVHVPSEHVYQRANVNKMVHVPRQNDRSARGQEEP